MKNSMRVHYDEEGDFLEISIGKPTECYADEIEPGVFLRKDEKTEEIKSIGIMNFKKRSKKVKDMQIDIPVRVSFSA
jgi:hypothetical protein